MVSPAAIAQRYQLPMTLSVWVPMFALNEPEHRQLKKMIPRIFGAAPYITTAVGHRMDPKLPYSVMLDVESIYSLLAVPSTFQQMVAAGRATQPWGEALGATLAKTKAPTNITTFSDPKRATDLTRTLASALQAAGIADWPPWRLEHARGLLENMMLQYVDKHGQNITVGKGQQVPTGYQPRFELKIAAELAVGRAGVAPEPRHAVVNQYGTVQRPGPAPPAVPVKLKPRTQVRRMMRTDEQ